MATLLKLNWLGGRPAKGERTYSEAELLESTLQERDQADEGWDMNARIAACQSGLDRGVRPEILTKIYGEGVVREAAATHAASVLPNISRSDRGVSRLPQQPNEQSAENIKPVSWTPRSVDDAVTAVLPAFLLEQKHIVQQTEGLIDTLFAHVCEMREKRPAVLADFERQLKETGLFAPRNLLEFSLKFYGARLRWRAASRLRPRLRREPILEQMIEIYRRLQAVDLNVPVPLWSPRIDTSDTIRGLGRLAYCVRYLKPDAIFTLNEGGELVGQFVKAHLNLSSRVRLINLRGEGDSLDFAGDQKEMDFAVARPVILDDIARRGTTMSMAIALIRKRFGVEPQIVVMAASVRAMENLRDHPVYAALPRREIATTVPLPYESHAGFAVDMQSGSPVYIFGAGAGRDRQLPVPAGLISKIEEDAG